MPGAWDALRPQRVSGALDVTPWPGILPLQSDAWTGSPRLRLRRGGVELFCAFAVTAVHTLADGVTVDAEDREQGVGLSWTCATSRSTSVTSNWASPCPPTWPNRSPPPATTCGNARRNASPSP